eukprot:5814829-Alexandrium_andersonii.AAC.1
MPNIEVGQPAAPVREFGPYMLATRVADPKGSIQRTITIQEHKQDDYVYGNNWLLFQDGVPR